MTKRCKIRDAKPFKLPASYTKVEHWNGRKWVPGNEKALAFSAWNDAPVAMDRTSERWSCANGRSILDVRRNERVTKRALKQLDR